jgi:hypothetical protein
VKNPDPAQGAFELPHELFANSAEFHADFFPAAVDVSHSPIADTTTSSAGIQNLHLHDFHLV